MDAEAVAAQIVASRVSRRKGKLDSDEAMQIAEFYWLVVEGLRRSNPAKGGPTTRGRRGPLPPPDASRGLV